MRVDLPGLQAVSNRAPACRIQAAAPPDRSLPRAMRNLGPMPDARLLARVRASAGGGDPKVILGEIKADFGKFQARHRGEMDGVQAEIDGINTRLAALGMAPLAGALDRVDDPAYSTPFASWFRHGGDEGELRQANASGARAQIQAAMSVGDNSQGGYLAPVEWDRTVSRKLLATSPMRRIANVVTTTGAGFSKVWAGSGWGSGWIGETATRPQTTTPTLASVTFKAAEIFAMPALTQILLDDAGFNVEEWLGNEVAETFALQEGISFLSGDGIVQPRGLLTYQDPNTPAHPGGNLVVVPSGAANGVTADGLIDFALSVPSPYRVGARWLMSSLTAAVVRKLKDGQGNYIWQNDYQAGQPASLLGFPVEIDENMPGVASGNTPIAFGDFKRGYTINDRFGIRVLRDPYTVKGYVLFYTTRRVGGGVSDPNAIRLLKIAAS